MAELLVKLKSQWMESIDPKDWVKHQITQEKFDRRGVQGDIIVVKPDGWKWGKRECHPEYVIVKCPELSYEKAKVLESQLYKGVDEDRELVAKRKYKINSSLLLLASLDIKGQVTEEKTSLYGNINEKYVNTLGVVNEKTGINLDG